MPGDTMRKLASVILPLLVAANLFAQGNPHIVINEFLASNISTNADVVDYDDFSDWIELYNAEDFDADIGAYSLTDNPGNPSKWKFPAGSVIPAKGYLIVWADGYNDIPGQTRQRPYSPYDNFVTRYYHLNFKLDQAGEFIGFFAPDLSLIDSVTFGYQLNDVSRGRQPDGSPNWLYFGEPTPAQPNATAGIQGTQLAGTPVVSLESGFFSGSQIVAIEAQPIGAQIRYTLDGSNPTSQSPLYVGSVPIAQTTVLRARVLEQDKLPGPIVTRTFFIDESSTLPVISITTPPDLLWGADIGIYDHIFRERVAPVHFEFFEPGGGPGFDLDAGLTLTGQLSIYYPQKSFTISAGARFGTDVMKYQVFPERKMNTFTSLYLRNGGLPDNRSTLIRDALLHALVLNKMDLDCQAYRPAATFLNGQYWGIYTVRDKINSSYLGTLHGINPADVDLLEYISTPEPDVMEGQAENYHAFIDYVANNDLANTENYRHLESWMDIDEYINYQITEIYADNVVWVDQNVRMWRERKEGARWRWILFDTDYGFGMPSQLSTGFTHNTLRFATSSNFGDPNILPLWSTLLFRKLLVNQEFKTKFIQRFASYLNSVFHPDSAVATLDQMQQTLSPGMSRHIARWRSGDYYYGYPIPDYPTWLSNVAVVRTFARNRPTYQRQHIIDYFTLGGISVLTLRTETPGMGQILVNGIERVSGNSNGKYFKGIPTRLEAVPEIGYRFVRWEGLDSLYANPVEVMPTQDSLQITAVFQPVSISMIPGQISADTILTAAHSPYYAFAGVTVDSGATLRIAQGVHIFMPEGASLVIQGRLLVEGTLQDPVVIEPNEHSRTWGALCFVNAAESSVVSYLHIIGATKGPDFIRDWAAVSGYKSRFCLQNVSVENVHMPVFVQFGSVTIRRCRLRSASAGDLINIKYADFALTEDNDLMGNGEFDSDGIDYDEVASGMIRGNRIYNIYGFNSDAIDLGEGAKNILVENNLIYNIADKGVSVGQASTTLIRRNVIANCGMGVGIKDFNSYARVEQNTFYANQIGVACYEKITGHGGAAIDVVNCILANSVQSSIFVDKLSNLAVSYSLSTTDSLPGLHNVRADPLFLNNLHLSTGSPAVDNGSPLLPSDPDGSLPDIGAYPWDPQKQNNLMIDEIHYHPKEGESYEFIELVNAGSSAVNLNGYQLTGSVEHRFGDVTVASGERIVLAKTSAIYDGQGYRVFQWEAGTLPDGAGSLLLYDSKGDSVDFVNYGNRFFWPSQPDGLGPSLELHRTSLENMVSNSWRSSYIQGGTPGHSGGSVSLSGLFINEFMAENDSSYADEMGEYDDWIEIYNSSTLPMDIGGLYITDNLNRPDKCLIPRNDPQQTTIPSGGFLLLWADGQIDQGILHLNFKLDRAGEQIGLVQALDAGFAFIDSLTYPAQSANVSYGRYPDGSASWGTFAHPTPMASNQGTNDVARDPQLPTTFSLSQNYPNPFNPTTEIRYQVAGACNVRFVVYDLLGREVTVLVSEKKAPGNYTVRLNASRLASGVYIYRLTAGSFQVTRKMVLIK
jgi:hypothetical protein